MGTIQVGRNNLTERQLITRKLPKILSMKSFASGAYGTDTNFGNGAVTQFSPEIKNPLLNPENFFLPKFQSNDGSPNIELNLWFDHYFRWNPLIGNLISLHSTLPISRFGLVGVTDKTILNTYEEMSDDMELFEGCQDILHQYFKRGEVQPFGWWDDDIGRFTAMSMLDTNYVYVRGHYLLKDKNGVSPEVYELYPDEYLMQLIKSQDPIDQDLLENLDDELREAVENNLSVILDPFSTNMIRRKVNSWDLRGVGILSNVLKILLLEDKLRESQFSSAQSNINPYRIWKLGDENNWADEEQLEDFRSVVQQAQFDSQMNIFSHHLLSLDIQGASGKADKMFQDFEYIEKQILSGLWSNKALTVSEGVSYNSSSVAMRVLMGRYIPIRNMLENYIYKKIFLPVALRHDFYDITQAELNHGVRRAKKDRTPLYPKFDWRHKQSLLDDQSIRSMLVQLQQSSKMPMKVLCDSLDLDYDYVKNWMEKEMNTVFDNDFIAGRKTIIASAMAGGLKDKAKGIVKRMIEAGVEWSKGVMGDSPNLDVEEDDTVEAQGDEEVEALTGEPTIEDEDKLPENVKKQKREFRQQYENDQIKQVNTINRKYAKSTKKMLEARSSSFKGTESTRSLAVKQVLDSEMDTKVANMLKQYLYDFKILFSKQGIKYIKGQEDVRTYVGETLALIEDDYNKKLYETMKISQANLENLLGKQLNENVFIKLSEFKIGNEFDNIKRIDPDVSKAYWNSITSNIEEQITHNFIKAGKLAEVKMLKQLRYDNIYVDGVKQSIDSPIEIKSGIKILPDTGEQEKLHIKVGKMVVKDVPVERYYDVKKVAEKYNTASEVAYEDDIVGVVGEKYFLNLYARLDVDIHDRIIDLYDKHYEGLDEEDWFKINGVRYIKQIEEQPMEVVAFYQNILK